MRLCRGRAPWTPGFLRKIERNLRERWKSPFPLWTWAALLTWVLALLLWWTSRPPEDITGLDVLFSDQDATFSEPKSSPANPSPDDMLRLAATAWATGDQEEALTWLEILHRGAPARLPDWAYAVAARALMEQGREGEAQIWLEEGLDRYPHNLTLWETLAELAFRQRDWARARAAYAYVVQHSPDHLEALWRLALLTGLDTPQQALQYVRRLTSQETYASRAQRLEAALIRGMAQEHPGARWVEIGRGLAQAGYWELALAAWSRATQQAPDYGPAWAYLGEGLARTGRRQEAWAAWRKARRLAPQEPLIPFLMGLQALREGRTAWAVGWLRRAVVLDSTQPLYRYHLAKALAGMRGFFPEAWMQVEALVATSPQDPLALRLAARFCLVHGVNIRSHALPWLRQARVLQPENPETLLLLGWAYMTLEDPDLSYRFLHQAWQRAPGNPDVHRLLAIWYRWQGNPEQARVHEAWAQKLASPLLP